MPNPSLLRILAAILAISLTPTALAGSYDDILVAANKDDTGQVVDLLKRGMDVNTADPAGNTLLMIASRNANLDLLDFLLRNRANTMKRNRFGDSAIMLAALRGHTEVAQRLLDAGTSPDNDGWTALHYSAFSGHADLCVLLASRGADVDAIAPNGQTPLMLAAAAGKLNAVKALVDADADMDIEDSEGRTALDLAIKGGLTAIAEYLRSEGAYEN